MDKIPEVEAAKALMTEAITWSVMKWLREKKRVRKIADQANAALDRLSETVRGQWPEPVRTAYVTLVARRNGAAITGHPKASSTKDSNVILFATQSKEKDDEAYRAKLDAEATFDLADKQLSTILAREGCRRAILSWELHEKAIRKAETLILSR